MSMEACQAILTFSGLYTPDLKEKHHAESC